MKLSVALIFAVAIFSPVVRADDAGPYKLLKSVTVGGAGTWDYVAVDSVNRRLYIPRASRVDVFDADSLAKVGEIPDTTGVHGVAFDPDTNRGFTSNRGNRNGVKPSVTVFDTKTLKVIQKIDVTGGPDGIFYDPATKHIFLESHSSPNETVINPADGTIVGTLDLDGEPEQGSSDGNGHVYINLESTSEVIVVDPVALKVTARYKLGDGDGPTGIGVDGKNRRIFSSCGGNGKLVVLDADNGNILTTLPLGDRTDAATFNPDTLESFSSNGDGTLTVVKENSPTSFVVEQNVQTKPGARTCALDAKTGNIYLVTAQFPPPSTQPGQGGESRPRRQAAIPNSFMILVVGKG